MASRLGRWNGADLEPVPFPRQDTGGPELRREVPLACDTETPARGVIVGRLEDRTRQVQEHVGLVDRHRACDGRRLEPPRCRTRNPESDQSGNREISSC